MHDARLERERGGGEEGRRGGKRHKERRIEGGIKTFVGIKTHKDRIGRVRVVIDGNIARKRE